MATLSSLIQRAGASFGVSIQRVENTLDYARRRTLERLGTGLVIDVGANRGQYGRHLRQSGYAGSILSFEPIPEAFAQLTRAREGDRAWDAREKALGANVEQRTFFVSENLVSSSLLAVTESSTAAHAPSRTEREIQVSVSTLDAEMEADERAIHLKMDTQGSELEVLRGATSSLGRVSSVECELSLVELYAGQPLFFEVSAFLYEVGFTASWLERGFQSPKRELLQVDALFVRERAKHRRLR